MNLLFFTGKKETVDDSLNQGKKIDVWTTSVEVFSYDDGEVVSSGKTVLDQINGDGGVANNNYRSSGVEVRIYYIDTADGGKGIAVNSVYGPPLWADGRDFYFAAYEYKDHKLFEIGRDDGEGSDMDSFVGLDVVKKQDWIILLTNGRIMITGMKQTAFLSRTQSLISGR